MCKNIVAEPAGGGWGGREAYFLRHFRRTYDMHNKWLSYQFASNIEAGREPCGTSDWPALCNVTEALITPHNLTEDENFHYWSKYEPDKRWINCGPSRGWASSRAERQKKTEYWKSTRIRCQPTYVFFTKTEHFLVTKTDRFIPKCCKIEITENILTELI